MVGSKDFNKWRKVLVVAANKDTILNTKYAPSDMKYKILRADSLVRQLQYDLDHRDKDDVLLSKKDMEESAKYYMDLNSREEIDYYEYYKNKFNLGNMVCPDCGGNLVKRNGKFGEFYGCSNYPKCKYTKKIS